MCFFFFFNDPSTTEIYTYLHTLSLTDACPISFGRVHGARRGEGPCRRTARGVELRDRLGGIARRRLYGDPRSADTPYPSRTTWRRRASGRQMARGAARSPFGEDRKRVVEGKNVSVRVDLRGLRIFKKKKY